MNDVSWLVWAACQERAEQLEHVSTFFIFEFNSKLALIIFRDIHLLSQVRVVVSYGLLF